MRRLVIVTAVIAACVGALTAAPVAADPEGGSGNGTFGFADSEGKPLGHEVPNYGGGDGAPVTYTVDMFDGLAPENGTFEYDDGCWGVSIADGDSGLTWAEAQAILTEYNDAQAWGVCAAEETFNLVTYVQQMWQTEVAPPPPTPIEVNGGHGALTGLVSYLEIGGEPHPTQVIPNPIGPNITITMTPRYVIAWGDGTSVETTSQGGPYPNGDLTHTYLDVGSVEVTVQAYWRATWSAGAVGGELPELPTPTSDGVDVPVEQRQVVIDG